MNRHPNTEAVIRLAVEKSEQARRRTREAIQKLQQQGKPINFSTVCEAAKVSKTFLYDPRHADLADPTMSDAFRGLYIKVHLHEHRR